MNIWYQRFLWLNVAYLLQRILFLALNYAELTSVSIFKIVGALLDGLRFDLCIIATINAPLVLFHLLRYLIPKLPFIYQRRTAKWLDHSVGFMFLFANIPLIVFGIVDSRLYAFTGRRITPATFDIGDDILNQSAGILTQYWFMTLPGLAVLFLFCKLVWQKDHTLVPFKMNRKQIFVMIAFLTSSVLASRGGLQTKPLAPAHAYHWQPTALSNMVLNSGMTFLRSPSAKQIKRFRDFQSQQEIAKILSAEEQEYETIPIAEGKNFVVIVVESLGTEYVGFLNEGKGYTPFLDQLAANSVYFSDSFANGRRSIDAIPAIFAGIPSWRDEPFITSPFVNNVIQPIPKTLKPLGYHSLFFHGAANGSMHFDSFASLVGFDQYIGKNEYPHKGHDDGQWGIYDEPFLNFASEKLTTTQEPFFAGIFTLTSHNPFKIPAELNDKFPKGTLPIHKSIGYADYALEQFFKSASKTNWYRNTIFIITGDHTSLSDVPKYNNLPGRFRVPMMFFDPSGRLPKVESSKVASHIDIAPTIFELIGAKLPSTGFFGGPLFQRSWRGHFFQMEYETWYYFDGHIQSIMDNTDQFRFYGKDDPLWQNKISVDQIPQASELQLRLKATRQYYTNGLLDNNWYAVP